MDSTYLNSSKTSLMKYPQMGFGTIVLKSSKGLKMKYVKWSSKSLKTIFKSQKSVSELYLVSLNKSNDEKLPSFVWQIIAI